jgi:glycosyltransferase involved in cell wall biosynthesis
MIPRVSIVMPCYNAAAHLNQSVNSVLAQSFGEWELIVVDDGSTDSSWVELQRLAKSDRRLRAIQQANSGAAIARNRGLSEARAEYTAFLDADDTWHPDFLATMLGTLDENPDAVIAYCGWQNLGRNGKSNKPFVPLDYENDEKILSLLGGCRWPIHAALTRSKALKDNGAFDPALSSCMDYDLWLRLGSVSKLLRVPKVLAYYHHHEGEQITHNKARIALNQWGVQEKFL